MLAHTNGKPRERHAILALNLEGGGGFEIWQHTGKKPRIIDFEIQLGDLGINMGILKSDNVDAAYSKFKSSGLQLLGDVTKDPLGNKHFYLKDVYNNLWEVKEHSKVFKKEKAVNGAFLGIPSFNGHFKTPSLRNIEVTGPYMHDGRLKTLEEVVEHYSTEVLPHPNLSAHMKDGNGEPRHLDLTPEESAALVAFMKTLTDYDLLTDVKYSNPFVD